MKRSLDEFSRCAASDAGGRALDMMPSGVKVYLASQSVDLRKVLDSLLSLVREAISGPLSGALYAVRVKRADRVKIVWRDGSGVRLFANVNPPRFNGGAEVDRRQPSSVSGRM